MILIHIYMYTVSYTHDKIVDILIHTFMHACRADILFSIDYRICFSFIVYYLYTFLQKATNVSKKILLLESIWNMFNV